MTCILRKQSIQLTLYDTHQCDMALIYSRNQLFRVEKIHCFDMLLIMTKQTVRFFQIHNSMYFWMLSSVKHSHVHFVQANLL